MGGSAAAAVDTSREDLAILTIRSDAQGDVINVTCPGGELKINGADPTGGAVTCGKVYSLTVIGGGGDDRINLGGFRQGDGAEPIVSISISAGPGDDRVVRSPTYTFDQPVFGGDGDDVISGEADLIVESTFGGAGNDRILSGGGLLGDYSGGPGRDIITLQPLAGFADVVRLADVRGGSGRDLIRGSGGTDEIDSGSGTDKILGRDGGDLLVGGRGTDLIYGGDGRDTLHGGPGRDRLRGGRDHDRVLQQGRTRLPALGADDF